MRILLVEDEDRSIRQVVPRIERAAPGCDLVVAMCRDDAIKSILNDEFDLIICDVRIPPTMASADISESHGLVVSATARRAAPGTPVIFLTAFSTGRDTRTQLSTGSTHMAFGIESYPMAFLCEKGDLDEIEARISTVNNAIESLETDCNIVESDVSDEMFLRAVRSYARQIGHRNVTIRSTGGLSGAVTGRVTLTSDSGDTASVFMKVASNAVAVHEYDQFNQYVPNRIQPGYSAPFIPPTLAGLRTKAALISTLADERCLPLFELLRQRPADAADAVRRLQEATASWWQRGNPTTVTLGELRKRRLTDGDAAAAGLSLARLEDDETLDVQVKTSISHGDLHGDNIFMDQSGRPIMIDFGDVGPGSAPLDPVTLELSILFHPHGPARDTDWGQNIDGGMWNEVEKFADGSPFEEFILACRSWAMQSDTPDSVYAVAYAHTLRQMKYPDSAKALAEAIAASARSMLPRS